MVGCIPKAENFLSFHKFPKKKLEQTTTTNEQSHLEIFKLIASIWFHFVSPIFSVDKRKNNNRPTQQRVD
jgi:hypothetical protein